MRCFYCNTKCGDREVCSACSKEQERLHKASIWSRKCSATVEVRKDSLTGMELAFQAAGFAVRSLSR
jgi:hypothetical protein